LLLRTGCGVGLDVYVGPLSRYYAGDWETIVQQAARQAGVPVRIIRPNQPAGEPKKSWLSKLTEKFRPRPAVTPDDTRRIVIGWRDRLRDEMEIPGLYWEEQPEAAYETDKPNWDGFGALLLWAAYEELPDSPRRQTAEDWNEDSALLTSRANTASCYRHLLSETEIWLPADFAAPFRTAALSGDEVAIGSSVRLLQELRDLNERTWQAGDTQIKEWRTQGAEHGAPLETSARFGFSVFYALAQYSVAARLPMKLDY
jgi:hypothetical protein